MAQTFTAPKITEGVIWKQLLSFFFPILLGTFFQQLYNTVDAIIVGRFVGTQALAAVGATSALINLFNGFFIGVSTGATVLISQFYGGSNRSGARDALHTGMVLSVILGLLATALGIFTGPQLLHLMQTPASCMDDAQIYLRLYFSGALASMIYNMGSGILRAMGDSKRPLLFLAAACAVNVVMDLLCVVIWDMGIAGAAVATVASQLISALLVLLVLVRLPDGMALRWHLLRLNKNLLGRILYVGIPAGLQFITFDLANVLIQSSINSFGDVAMAAWTAYSKTDAMTWQITGAFGVSITTFVGQNFGAQKYGRIRQSVRVCMGMSLAIVGAMSAIELLLCDFILGIYTADPDVIRTGAYVMLCIIPFNVLFMPVEVFAGAMRGTGYSIVPTVITCTCVCLFRVVWIWVVVNRWHHMGLLAMAYPLSWGLCAIVFTIAYLRGTWLHKRIAQIGLEPEVRK